jgi:long-chain-fatty-acid--CoA ligase ACSBG
LFGRALIALGVEEHTSLNLIGFNAPEWNIAFFGSIFARCLPTGIYTTNSVKSCEYVAQHSECKIVVAENFEYAQKYMGLLEKGDLKYIILYNDPNFKIPPQYERVLYHWKQFMLEGVRV